MNWQEFPGAPPTGTVITSKGNEVADGSVHCISVGDFNIILVYREGTFRCYVNACPHQYLPLNHRSENVLSACSHLLRCSNHGAGFDLLTGVGKEGFGIGSSLIAIPVIVADGIVSIGQ